MGFVCLQVWHHRGIAWQNSSLGCPRSPPSAEPALVWGDLPKSRAQCASGPQGPGASEVNPKGKLGKMELNHLRPRVEGLKVGVGALQLLPCLPDSQHESQHGCALLLEGDKSICFQKSPAGKHPPNRELSSISFLFIWLPS